MINAEEKKVLQKIFWSGEEISTDFLSQYYENELSQIKSENVLLGDFVGEKYIFNSEVKKGLIALKKKIEEKVDSNYILVSKGTKCVFNFKLKIFDTGKDNLMAANLYLVEIVDDERFKNPIKTFVAQFVDESNAEFINKAKYIFNISIEEEFLEREKIQNDEIIKPMLPKFPLNIQEELERIARKYVEGMLEALETSESDVAKKILNDYKNNIPAKDTNTIIPFLILMRKLNFIIEKYIKREDLVILVPKAADVVKTFNEETKKAKTSSVLFDNTPDEKKKPKDDEKAKKEEGKKPAPPKKPTAKKGSAGEKKPGKPGAKKGGGGPKKKKQEKKMEEKQPIVGAVKFEKLKLENPHLHIVKPNIPTKKIIFQKPKINKNVKDLKKFLYSNDDKFDNEENLFSLNHTERIKNPGERINV